MTAPNTSATGGYLRPFSPAVTEDLDIDEFMQAVVVGITGLDGTMVRPRWQPGITLPQPNQGVDWAAIGVIDEVTDSNAMIRHFSQLPDGVGYDEEQRHVTYEWLVSFYGPHSRNLASLLRDGLYIAQNREQLILNGMAFVNTDRLINIPELIDNIWRSRVDLTFRVRRVIVRTYAIENILEGVGTIETDTAGTEPWDTANRRIPPP